MLPGAVGLHWFYAALMASYLLMGVGEASLLIIAAVTFLVVDGGAFASLTQMWPFVVATALVILFAFVFRWRPDAQPLQLELLATLDPLTGCSNRRSMDPDLWIVTHANARTPTPFATHILHLP